MVIIILEMIQHDWWYWLLNGRAVTVIGQQRGKDTKDNIYRNFGMAHPEGYRKALRLMKQAEKFNRPIFTFIDTKGAYPGKAAEERGQSESIATNLIEMASLKTSYCGLSLVKVAVEVP